MPRLPGGLPRLLGPLKVLLLALLQLAGSACAHGQTRATEGCTERIDGAGGMPAECSGVHVCEQALSASGGISLTGSLLEPFGSGLALAAGALCSLGGAVGGNGACQAVEGLVAGRATSIQLHGTNNLLYLCQALRLASQALLLRLKLCSGVAGLLQR